MFDFTQSEIVIPPLRASALIHGLRTSLSEIQDAFISVRLRSLFPNSPVGRIMSFDPMAAAADWLDAYRAADIESIPTKQ